MSATFQQIAALDRVLGSAPQALAPSLFTQAQPLSLKIKDGVRINRDLTKLQSNQTVDALLGINRTKEEREPKQISYQLLAEAGRAMSPEAFLSSSLNADNSSAEVLSSQNNQQSVQQASQLSDNSQRVYNEKVQEGLKSFGARKATVTEQKVKHNEMAAGGITTVSAVKNDVAGIHQIYSEVSHSVQAPSVEVLAQNQDTVVNGVDSRVVGMQLANYQQSVKQIQGSELKTAGNSLKVVFDSDEKVAKSVKSTGTETHTTLAKKNSVTGDSEVEVFSAGSLANISYADTASIFGGSLSVVGSSNVVPTNHPSKLTELSSSPPSIQFAVFNEDKYSGLSIGDSISGSAPQIALQSENATLALTRMYASLIGRGLVLSDGRNSIMSFGGGQLHVNLPIGNSFRPSPPPQVNDPISAVTLPSLPTQQLENCIPASIKEQQREARKAEISLNKPGDKGSIKSKLFRQGISPEEFKPSSGPANQQKNLASIKDQERKGAIADSSLKANINPNTKSTTGQINKAIAPIPAVGITNIYSKSSFSNNSAMSILLAGADDSGALPERELLARSLRGRVTSQGILSALQPLVNSSQLTTRVIQSIADSSDVVALAIEIGVDEINPSISLASFPSYVPREQAQRFVDIIRQYPQIIEPLKDYLVSLAKPVAIGFLAGLGGISLAGGILNNIGIKLPGLSLISQIPTILNASSPLEMARVGIQGLQSLGIRIPGVDVAEALIGSFDSKKETFSPSPQLADRVTSLLGIQDQNITALASSLLRDPSILRGDIGELMSGPLGQTVQQALSGKVSEILGPQLGPAVPQLVSFISNPQGNTAEEYIAQISSILSSATGISDISRAGQIYTSITSLIEASKSQDLLQLIGGQSLESLVSNVLGEANSPEISRVFNIVRQSVGLAESISLLPFLLEKMDDYSIPALEQVGLVFSCLDLLNKIKGLIDSFKRDSRGFDENRQVIPQAPVNPQAFEVAISNSVVGPTDRSAIFEVSLGAALSVPLTLQYRTINNSAVAGTDFLGAEGVVRFAPGERVKRIGVQLIPRLEEPPRNFSVVISNPTSQVPVRIVRREGICFIESSSGLPVTTDEQVGSLIEQLPRVVQLVNSVQTVVNSNNPLPPELLFLTSVQVPDYLDPCLKLSPLTISEADITLLGLYQGFAIFSMTNLPYLVVDNSTIPREGGLIRLQIESYLDSDSGVRLMPFADVGRFTPRTLTFTITRFDLQRNIGIAFYQSPNVPIILEEQDSDLLYEFSPLSIGSRIIPSVIDSYLL